jgi:CheY-like chemotaxis protein
MTAGGRPLERRAPRSGGCGEEPMASIGARSRGETMGAGGAAADRRASAEGWQPSAERPAGVLVVDDSRVFRTGMVRAVRACPGLELLGEAEDGEEALEAIDELSPEVVILDLRMPRLDGFGVLDRLHEGCEEAPCRVLVISAALDDGVGDEVLAAGADAVLSKAVSRAEICDEVLRLAALQRRRRAPH